MCSMQNKIGLYIIILHCYIFHSISLSMINKKESYVLYNTNSVIQPIYMLQCVYKERQYMNDYFTNK